MSVQWKVVFWLSLWIVCAVKAQLDEGGDFDDDSDEYDDWTDHFENIFKNADEYEDTLNKINSARDRSDKYDETNIDVNELLDNNDDEFQNDINEDDNFGKPFLSDMDTELQVEDTEDRINGDVENNSYESPDKDASREEVIGDENMNGNAPANEFDPLANDDNDSNVMESPYKELINVNPELFDDTLKEDVNSIQKSDNENFESRIVQSSEDQLEKELSESDDIITHEIDNVAEEDDVEQLYENESNKQNSLNNKLEDLFQETEDILNNNSDNSNLEDELDQIKEDTEIEEMPDDIIKETQDIVNQDSKDNDFSDNSNSESVDNIYEDLDEDLENLFATIEKLKKDESVNSNLDQSGSIHEDAPSEENKVKSEWEDFESDEKSNEDQSKTVDEYQDSSEKERLEREELYALIEKQLQEMEENNDLNSNTEEDYNDFYDDDNQENDTKEVNKLAPIPYGNDAIDPNEQASIMQNEEIIKEQAVTITDVKEKVVDVTENQIDEPTPKDKEVIDLSSKELSDKINTFRSLYQDDIELNAEMTDVPAIHRTLSIDEAIVITSPDYPSPYPGNNVIDWFFDGENGTGIEINITDFSVNGDAGDYLLIKPGGMDISSNDGIIFSYHLRHERRYRFFDIDELFVRFESKAATNNFFRGFNFSVKFIDHKVERNLEPEPTPEAVVEKPEQTMTVHLTGLAPHEFKNISEQFRDILVDMTTMYVTRNDVDPGELPLSDVVQLTRVTICNINWPDHHACSAVTFGVPLFYNTTEQEAEYQLSSEQLLDMWLTFSSIDPFAVRLRLLGITEYDVPNDRAVMSTWWLISFAVLMLILGVGFALWRWNCFEDYTGMTRLSETESVYSETRKSDLDLYPTPHQNLPPMFAGDQYGEYLDGDLPAKYDDTARVDMGGAFDNKTFVRDGELFDLDSDEEIIMSLPDEGKSAARNSSNIRPKDIFEV